MSLIADNNVVDPRRRDFLARAAAAGVLLGFAQPLRAAEIRSLSGELYVNGRRAAASTPIRPGDELVTGPDASVTFVLGQDAFLLRQMSALRIEGGGIAASGFRIVTGALLSVFGRGARTIRTATLTAGIRGTGIYVETSSLFTYFCTCYGDVDLACDDCRETKAVRAKSHTPNYVAGQMIRGEMAMKMMGAPLLNHSNAELAMLERLVGRESPLGP